MLMLLISKINNALYKVEVAYDNLNGWKKVMLSAILLIPSWLDLLPDAVQIITATASFVTIIWACVKGYWEIRHKAEDLKMKRLKRQIMEQEHYGNFVADKLKSKED